MKMKLLLTSAGFVNPTIISALGSLVQRPFEELSVAYIPTASNGEEGDKWWVIEEMDGVKKLGWSLFDIVDFSALPRSKWLRRLAAVDVLVFGGGSSYHLMESIESSGFREAFENQMKDKVYVGISAGSMIATGHVHFAWDRDFYGIETLKESGDGLGLVDFQIMPHLNLSAFPKVTLQNIEVLAENIKEPLYAIDNDSALVVDDDKVSVVSEGQWKKFN